MRQPNPWLPEAWSTEPPAWFTYDTYITRDGRKLIESQTDERLATAVVRAKGLLTARAMLGAGTLRTVTPPTTLRRVA